MMMDRDYLYGKLGSDAALLGNGRYTLELIKSPLDNNNIAQYDQQYLPIKHEEIIYRSEIRRKDGKAIKNQKPSYTFRDK
ncbi:hypothetical protein O3M35_010646 [Rhynocoris fuscipes]|uniref:Uncharacterized protein n=1 Tax=Rhynocoris fuscipes TaxID=488301 RepID=A0AAW1D548_9HEMI